MRQRVGEQIKDVKEYAKSLDQKDRVWLKATLKGVYGVFLRDVAHRAPTLEKEDLIEEDNSYRRDLMSYGQNVADRGFEFREEEESWSEFQDRQARDKKHYKCLVCHEIKCRCDRVRQLGYRTDDYIRPMMNENTAINNVEILRAAEKLRLERRPEKPKKVYAEGAKVVLQPQSHLSTYRGNVVISRHALHGRNGTVMEYCPRRKSYLVRAWYVKGFVLVYVKSYELKEVI
jgi:hypothetical protein